MFAFSHIVRRRFLGSAALPIWTVGLSLLVFAQLTAGSMLEARTPPQFADYDDVAANLQPAPGQELRVDLLTVEPGKEFYSVWGHTALRIYDSKTRRDMVFDFGMFMPDRLFLLKFLHNQPAYLLWVTSLPDTLYHYARLNRTVKAQQIFLSDEEARSLLRKLAINSLPQNRVYRYHHYFNNCTTKLRDILDEDYFGGRFRATYSQRTNDTSFRPLADGLLTYDPPYWLAINLIQGTLVDRPVSAWEEMFLPIKFMNYLDEFRGQDGADRIGPIQLIQKAPEPIDRGNAALAWAKLTIPYCLLVAILYLWPALRPDHRIARRVGNIARWLWYIGAGFAGVILSILWFYAEQDSLDNNINLLAYSPLLLLMPIAHIWLRRPEHHELSLKLHLFFAAWPALGILLVLTTIHPQISGLIFLLPSLIIQLLIYLYLKRRSS
ncbi:MAG: DUF4105 domain-containing protein [bacterium]|nr:DUF4105 domain-containing protein [bacterium]